MAGRPGHIELQRALDSIEIGRRHRTDLGDIDTLAASIERDGLLQPITITPDGVLVCGLRRLAAMRHLGWKTANVWVRSGITERLGRLLAEQDDNTLHKPLTQTEAAALYRELKGLLAEDAARRQEASRFAPGGQTAQSDGGATVAPPSGTAGKTRQQAAVMVTGHNSYTTLERVNDLQRLAADPSQPEVVRSRAAAELDEIDAGGSITAAHQRMRAELSLAELDQLAGRADTPAPLRERAAQNAAELRAAEADTRAADLERLAADALARVRAEGKRERLPKPAASNASGTAPMSVRAFVLTWDDLHGWWERCDPADIGPALAEAQWERFEQTVAHTVAFAEEAAAVRRRSALRSA